MISKAGLYLIKCPNCGREIVCFLDAIGRVVECPHCFHVEEDLKVL